MGKCIRQQVGNREKNNRVFGWGIMGTILFAVAAAAVNAFFWSSDPTPAIADAVIQRSSPDPVGNQAPK